MVIIYAVGETAEEAFLNFESKLKSEFQSMNFSVAKCESNRNIETPTITIDVYRTPDKRLIQATLEMQSVQNDGKFYLRSKFEI